MSPRRYFICNEEAKKPVLVNMVPEMQEHIARIALQHTHPPKDLGRKEDIMSKIIRLTETVLVTDNKVKSRLVCRIRKICYQSWLLDQAGFHALEAWGGATFDSCACFEWKTHKRLCHLRSS